MDKELPRSFPWKIGHTKGYFTLIAIASALYFGLFGAILFWVASDMQGQGLVSLPVVLFVLAVVGGIWLVALLFTLSPWQPFSISFGRDAIETRSLLGRRTYPAAGSILDIRVEERTAHNQAEGIEIPGIVRPVVISFVDGRQWTLPENTVRAFGQSPEGLADALRRLYYGHMAAPDQKKANEMIAAANEWLKKNDMDKAVAAFGQAMRLYPPYVSYELIIGDQLFKKKNFAEAALAYGRLADAMPEHDQAWGSLGKCLVLTGKYADGLQALDRSLKLNPDDALTWYYSAMAQVILKDSVKAKADLEKVLSLKPDWEAGARKEPLFIDLFK